MFQSFGYIQNPWCWFLFLGSLCATAILTPFVMRLARRVGAVDEGGYRRVFEGSMPLLGGLGVAVPLLTLCALVSGAGYILVGEEYIRWIVRHYPQWFSAFMELVTMRGQLAVLVIGGTLILALGVVDDIWGLRARTKLLGQIAAAVFVCLMGYAMDRIYIPLLGELNLGTYWGFFFSVLWIVGLINAFNLIDGVDGLATGVTLIASLSLIVLGLISQSPLIVYLCTVLSGSLLAFLFFNFHPARIFLGDTGSMFLGFAMATITLMAAYKSEAAMIILAPMLVLSLPIFETLISMLRRYIHGVPIFTGDKRHTHHRLLGRGYSQSQVVLMLYAVAFFLSSAAILSRVIPPRSSWTWIPAALFAGTLLGIMWLAGYFRSASINRVFKRRTRNAVLVAFAKYVTLSYQLNPIKERLAEIMKDARRELRLGFLEAWFEEGRALIDASGGAAGSGSEPGRLDSVEKLRVTTRGGHFLVIRYQFAHSPDASERHDVEACLASIFEKMDLQPPSAKIVSVEGEDEKTDAEDREVRKENKN